MNNINKQQQQQQQQQRSTYYSHPSVSVAAVRHVPRPIQTSSRRAEHHHVLDDDDVILVNRHGQHPASKSQVMCGTAKVLGLCAKFLELYCFVLFSFVLTLVLHTGPLKKVGWGVKATTTTEIATTNSGSGRSEPIPLKVTTKPPQTSTTNEQQAAAITSINDGNTICTTLTAQHHVPNTTTTAATATPRWGDDDESSEEEEDPPELASPLLIDPHISDHHHQQQPPPPLSSNWVRVCNVFALIGTFKTTTSLVDFLLICQYYVSTAATRIITTTTL